jgi:ribosomal-protein-alanine N-acetyltransferase
MTRRRAPHPIFSTPRLRLRQFRVEDTDAMHECFANPEAMRFWDSAVHSTRTETERVVRNFVSCTPSYYRIWAVADAATDRCLGMVNYHDRHIRNQCVTIGYIIDPAHQRRGIATEAVSVILDYCFGKLGLHRIQAFIHPDNAGSRRLVETFGFRCEGLLRDNLRVGNVWRDDMLYALLGSDRGDGRGHDRISHNEPR